MTAARPDRPDEFRLLMIGAMYENGGNTTHRLFDGHPDMWVYPFESQLGTRAVSDALASVFPAKYRWPVFPLEGTPAEDYRAIIDEEAKVRARTPSVSKFRHVAFDLSDDERRRLYEGYVVAEGRSRSNNVAAFFRATFEAWPGVRRSGRERVYVGYSPIVVVDADKILSDFPQAHVLHVVRNPWSAYADHKKRPVPQLLGDYMLGWALNQYFALLFQKQFPDRVHVVRLEDVLENPFETLGAICERIGLERSDALRAPSWNGEPLREVKPWGTIVHATPEANRTTAGELSAAEREAVRDRARPFLEVLGYDRFLD